MPAMHLGLIGVGTMGQSLTLNIERNGFPVAVYDRDVAKTRDFLAGNAKGRRIAGGDSLEQFLALLQPPRRIVLLVNAGKPVDDVIGALRPHLSPGDILVDAGNSHFSDTERRQEELASAGVSLIGSGVSGGEEGALKGPSIMPGGPREAFDAVAPVLTAIAARVNGDPCCAYMGPRGAGHYVKMVHNGIEYAIIQLISEVYDILCSGLGYSPAKIADIFEQWNSGELSSFLCEITARVLRTKDPDTGKPLVDLILDTAEQKGTGKWASQSAFDLGVPVPTINTAVEMRMLSALRAQRLAAGALLHGPGRGLKGADVLVPALHDALHASMIVSYAQGLALLKGASDEFHYELKLNEIAGIWRGGCIIRARMLEPIRAVFAKNPPPVNLMIDHGFAAILSQTQAPWREAVRAATAHGIPAPGMAASLAYYDAYRAARLPANLVQGQRDLFGAHGYKRLDKEGTFHTRW